MGRTYLPSTIDQKLVFFNAFAQAMGEFGAGLGFSAAEIEAVAEASQRAQADCAARVAAESAFRSAVARQAETIEGAAGLIRSAVFRLQAMPQMTDPMRLAFHITVPDRVRTAAPAPASAPFVQVRASGPRMHAVSWMDAQEGRRRRRPRGVDAVEIWARIAPPDRSARTLEPGEPLGLRYLRSIKRSSTVIEYAGDEVGLRAEYFLRYVNTRGVRGPFGDPAGMVIAA